MNVNIKQKYLPDSGYRLNKSMQPIKLQQIKQLKSSFSAGTCINTSGLSPEDHQSEEKGSAGRIRNGFLKRVVRPPTIINGAGRQKVRDARFTSGAKNDFRSLRHAANEPRYPVSRHARIRLPGEHGGWPVRCVSSLSCPPAPILRVRSSSRYRFLAEERFSLDTVQETMPPTDVTRFRSSQIENILEKMSERP